MKDIIEHLQEAREANLLPDVMRWDLKHGPTEAQIRAFEVLFPGFLSDSPQRSPQTPREEPESPFEPYRGEPWCKELLPPLETQDEPKAFLCPECGVHTQWTRCPNIVCNARTVPCVVLPPPPRPAASSEGPAGPVGPVVNYEPHPRVVHPTMTCQECGDDQLVMSQEEGEEGFYRCAGSCALHEDPNYVPDEVDHPYGAYPGEI